MEDSEKNTRGVGGFKPKIFCVVGTSNTLIFFVFFQDPPSHPSFTVKPVNQTALEGGRTTFYCAASGNPSPTITWSKLNGNISADRRQEPSPGSLRIVNLQPGDIGIYVCTAQNSEGSITAQAFLRIQGSVCLNLRWIDVTTCIELKFEIHAQLYTQMYWLFSFCEHINILSDLEGIGLPLASNYATCKVINHTFFTAFAS